MRLSAMYRSRVGLLSRLMLILWVASSVVVGWPEPVAAQEAPGQAAETVRAQLVQAQLLWDVDPAAARQALATATAVYYQNLAPHLTRAAPQAAARLEHGLQAAASATDATSLAVARAQVWTALLAGGLDVVQDAITSGQATAARAWLPVREFRQATRFSRPNADASVAVARLVAGDVAAETVLQAVRADLLDTYQSRLNQALDDAVSARDRGFAARAAEAAALAEGYFAILAPAFAEQRGAEAATTAGQAFATLRAATVDGEPLTSPIDDARAVLQGFRAAPLSLAEQTRRAGQMVRFLNLVPIEYERGVRNGQVTIDLEVREAITFADAAAAAFTDLRTLLENAKPEATQDAAAHFAALEQLLAAAAAGNSVADPGAVRGQTNALLALLQSIMPADWQRQDSSADFDVIAAALDQMQAAATAGAYEQAESARLEAYAILESGPEAKLVAFAPQYVTPIEELFWYGQGTNAGLAYLIDRQAGRMEIMATRQALDQQLAAAQEAIGGDSAPLAVATNAGIIVFREGLEAVVILAVLMASMVGAKRVYRRPMVVGVLLALAATAVTWWLAQQVLTTFSRYGERLEAVVSLIAIGVLLLITNWFFHQVYWTDHLASFHARKKALMGGVVTGQMLGFVLLGFSSVYREGFETVLFLQALVLESGLWTVIQGVAVGIAGVLAIGLVTFKFQSRLPYKKMLVWTGVLIGAVLLVMVGNTVHAMQVVGWLPTHPMRGLTLPYWAGLWFGVYATWEGVALQAAAMLFVLGSYYLAEFRRPGRRHTPATAQHVATPRREPNKAHATPASTMLAAEPTATGELAVSRIVEFNSD